MRLWLAGLVACLLLLAGCGGGFHGSLGPRDSFPPASPAESDEPLAEELSSKHLAELYAKGGISLSDPGLEAELRKWEHQAKFDVPIQMNQQVKAYLVYFSTERKKVVQRWLARSSRYLPLIKGIFQEYGLPEDLAYLAMIESGFNPNAYSPAGACGMWQFIKGTGLRYGLVINNQVDERRDPVKSTRAAARYLTDLYQQFGSWYLAAASYNCGERRVEKELRKGHRNFWELSANRCLPSETKNYVPQLIAATIIAKNPEKFGFGQVPYQSPLSPPAVQLAQSTPDLSPPVLASLPLPVRRPVSDHGPASMQPRSPSRARVMLARPAPHPSKAPGKKQKPTTQVAQARNSSHPAGHLRNQPHVASLFGYPAAKPKKSLAREPQKYQAKGQKSQKQDRVYAQRKKPSHRVVSKDKKPSQAIFAKRGQAKHPQAHLSKKSKPGKKGKYAKTKPKPLLVSRAW